MFPFVRLRSVKIKLYVFIGVDLPSLSIVNVHSPIPNSYRCSSPWSLSACELKYLFLTISVNHIINKASVFWAVLVEPFVNVNTNSQIRNQKIQKLWSYLIYCELWILLSYSIIFQSSLVIQAFRPIVYDKIRQMLKNRTTYLQIRNQKIHKLAYVGCNLSICCLIIEAFSLTVYDFKD